MLGHLVDRLRQCHELDDIVLATSEDASDDPVAAFAMKEGLRCYRGALEDVASRLLAAAEAVRADALVRISGDSPLIDSFLIDRLFLMFREADGPEIVTNVATRTFPKGQSVEVISTVALRRHIETGMTASQKEHVTTCFYQQPKTTRIINVEHPELVGDMQLSVDTEEDMERFDNLLGLLGEPYWSHGLDRIVEAANRLGSRAT